MTTLKIKNPFNAPVYHEKIISSTMDISRQLASAGEIHGTVITADFQEAGRGRVRGRTWEMESETSLPFTILLRYPGIEKIPPLITLRAGLAVSLAIEDFVPSLKNAVMIKWPNDIIINSKKTAGILCEADGSGNVYLGIGINFTQKEFPAHLSEKATSIAITANRDIMFNERFILLEKILTCFYDELQTCSNVLISRIEQKLFKKGELVIFIEGAADSGKTVKGRLAGITEGGELLIETACETQAPSVQHTKLCSFITGELKVF